VVSDVDSTNVTATLTLSAAAGVLNGAGAGVLNAGTLTYTITGTQAAVNTALAAVTYDSADNFNGTTNVGVTIDDGASGPQGTNPTGTVDIHVTAVNDAPTATNLTQSLTINEDAAATTLFTLAPVVSDVDSTNVTATLTLSAAAGVLNGAGAGVLNAGTLTYTITGTQAAVNTALAAVTYDSADNFNGTTNVGVTIDDGASGPQGTNPTGTVDIHVTAVNDAPTLSATANNPAYTPGGVDLFSTVTASTGPADESTQQLQKLVLTVTHVSGVAGEDVLTIDGTPVDLDTSHSETTTGPLGVNAAVAYDSGTGTTTVTITSAGLGATDMASLVDGLSYADNNVTAGETARVVTLTSLQDTGGGTAPNVDTATLNIASTVNFNVAPTVTAGGTLTYTENATSLIDNTITITDPDNPNMVGATVAITGGFDNTQDVLSFTPSGGVIGSYNASTGVLTLTGTATQAQYETVLESVTYHNTSDDPTTTQRTVSYTVNDGFVDSAPGTATINITAVNDEPTLTATALNPGFTENGSAVGLFSGAAASAIEAGQNLDQLVLTVTNVAGTGATEDLTIDGTVIALTNGNTQTTATNGMSVVVALAAGTATVTVSKVGGISSTAMNTLVNDLAYSNTSDDPGNANRVVTLTSLRDTGANGGANNDDNIHSGLTVQSTVTVTPVNDEPTLTGVTSLNPGFTENGAAVTLFSGGTASAVEAGQSLNNLAVTVSNVAGTGSTESLFIDGTTVALNTHSVTTATNGMTADVILTGGTATVTISHAGGVSAATIQGIVDGLKYGNTSEDPGAATRVVTIASLSDTGSNVTPNDNIAAFNIHSDVAVTPVNDAPTVVFGTINGFTEPANGTPAASSTPVTIAPNLTVSDVDSTNLTQATFVLNNLKPSDALSVSGFAGTSGDIGGVGGIHFAITSTAGTETVTLTGTHTIADYNAALHLVQFNNTSENPDQTARSYTVTAVDDGTGTNTGSASTTETVTGVNDAPVNTVPVEQDTIFSRTATAITGLSVSDVDSGAGETTVLSVAHGTLNVATVGGGATVTNNGTVAVTLTGTAEQIATTLAASNGVVYTSGAFTGTDVLTVTTNDNGATGTGTHPNVVSTENLGVIPKVWFIDNSATGAQDGSQAHPFQSLASFNAATTGANDYVYLKTGTGTYSGGIVLQDGQILIGQGDALTFPDPLHVGNTLTIENAGTTPKIVPGAGVVGIDLASGNTIHGLNVDTSTNGSAVAIDDGPAANSVGNLTISNLDILGAGKAIDIDHGGGTLNVTIDSLTSSGSTTQGVNLGGAMTGSFNISAGSISGSTGVAFNVNGGTFNIDDNGSIAKTSSGQAISLVNHTAGTINFDGSVASTSSSTGINLTGNTSAVMTFDGGVNVSTSSGTGLNATGGGTLIVTGTTANNHLTTNTGTAALNVNGVTIGTGGLNFHDIFANGSTNGIVLNTTGSTAGLTVTGDSGALSNHSGGQILGSTGPGVSLNSTSNVSLGYLDIQNGADDGIHGESVNGFTLNHANVTNNGNSTADDGIQFGLESGNTVGLTGAVSITNSAITGNAHNDVHIRDTSGTISSLTVSGSTIGGFNGGGANAANAFLFEGSGTSALTSANFSGNTVQNNTSDRGLEVQAHDTATIGTFTVQNNAFINNGIQASFTQDGSSNLTFKFLSNGTAGTPMTGAVLQALNVFSSSQSTGGSITGTIQNNFIGNPAVAGSGSTGGQGIRILVQGQTDSTLLIDNNTIRQVGQTSGSRGIDAQFLGPTATGLGVTSFNDITITNNHVQTDAPAGTFPLAAIFLGADNQGSPAQVRANIHDNVVPATGSFDYPSFDGNGGQLVFVNVTAGAIAQLVDNAPASGTATAELQSHNTGNSFANGVTLIAGPISTPPLNAAPGGVQALVPTPGETNLSQAELNSVVAAAIAQWAAAGASPSQLAAMLAVSFTVADLAGDRIGEQSSPKHITIDTDAAGHGWFVDSTPNDNSEFTHAANAAGTDLYTDPSNAAAGHMDLLTAVTHELGHVIGLDDSTSGDVHDLMYIDLVDGERRVPDATDVAQANVANVEAAVPVAAQAAAGTPIITGTAGNDTIDAGHGGNILFGGVGADNFVFGPSIQLNAPTPAQITHVADYHAAQGDTFDFSGLTSAFHNSSVNDSLVVRAVEDASGKFATLQVDHIDPMGLPSAPNWVNVAQLDGAHTGDSVNVLIDSHSSVHLAQIHVDLLV
jgi:hypothetical protein